LQLAANGPTAFIALSDLAFTHKERFGSLFPLVHALVTDLDAAIGEMIAASQETGTAGRAGELVSSGLLAVTVTSNVFCAR